MFTGTVNHIFGIKGRLCLKSQLNREAAVFSHGHQLKQTKCSVHWQIGCIASTTLRCGGIFLSVIFSHIYMRPPFVLGTDTWGVFTTVIVMPVVILGFPHTNIVFTFKLPVRLSIRERGDRRCKCEISGPTVVMLAEM